MSLPLKVKDPKCGHRWRVDPDDLIDPDWLKCPICNSTDRNTGDKATRISENGRPCDAGTDSERRK